MQRKSVARSDRTEKSQMSQPNAQEPEMLHLVTSHKTGNFMMFSNDQVNSKRCHYVTSGEWTLDDQTRMADAFGFCREIRNGRLCGGNVRPGKQKCKKCPDLGDPEAPPPTPTIDHKILRACFSLPKTASQQSQTPKFAPRRVTCDMGCQTDTQTVSFTTSTHRYTVTIEPLEKGLTVSEIETEKMQNVLVKAYTKSSLANGKTYFKQTCKILGEDHLTLRRHTYAEKMLALGHDAFFAKTKEFKQHSKLCDSAAKLMVLCGCQEFRDQLHILRLPEMQEKNALKPTPLKKERMEIIIKLLGHYDQRTMSGLLGVLRAKTFDFHPEDAVGRRWKFRELLAWHWPAIRDMSSTFVIRHCDLPKIKEAGCNKKENSIHVRDGEVVGLHFGRMKGTASSGKQRIVKTFNLRAGGMQSFQEDSLVHLTDAEYSTFWQATKAVLEEHLETRPPLSAGDFIFKLTKSERNQQKKLVKRFAAYHGQPVKTMVARLIFRNAYAEKESHGFYHTTMGHGDVLDLQYYWKPELHGAKLADVLPRRDES
jgi:hypothetical protein